MEGWIKEEEGSADFPVWPENWPTLRAFLSMSTQWRWTGGMDSRRCGLDYNALPITFEMLGIPRREQSEVFRGLQVMESEVLNLLMSS